MKLKYIFLAIIGAATMGACSDDVPTPDNREEAMVSLSLGVNNGAIYTKAAGDREDLNGLAGEAQINRLTILLFDSNGALAVKKDTVDIKETPTNIPLNRIGNVIVPRGTYDILIVANADDDIMNITSKAGLEAYQGKLASQNQRNCTTASSNLLMTSKYYTGVELQSLTSSDGEPLRYTYNYFGEKSNAKNIEASETARATTWYTESTAIPLTRLAARIQVKSVKVQFKEDLVGGAFKLDSIYIANVRPVTRLVPDANNSFETAPDAAPFYLRGAPATVVEKDHLIYPFAGAVPTPNDVFVQQFGFSSGAAANRIKDGETYPVDIYTYDGPKMPFWYVFENQIPEESPRNATPTVYNTRVMISGRVVTPAGVELPRSYFSVVIKDKDVDKLVERNKIYQIAFTIGGLGSDNPDKVMDNAMITATVTAEDWKVVIHEEDIED